MPVTNSSYTDYDSSSGMRSSIMIHQWPRFVTWMGEVKEKILDLGWFVLIWQPQYWSPEAPSQNRRSLLHNSDSKE